MTATVTIMKPKDRASEREREINQTCVQILEKTKGRENNEQDERNNQIMSSTKECTGTKCIKHKQKRLRFLTRTNTQTDTHAHLKF